MQEQTDRKRHRSALPAALGVLLLAAASAYTGGRLYYQNHFLPGTEIDRIDVSGLTIEELKGRAEEYFLCVTERRTDGSSLEEEIKGTEISLTYASEEPLEKLLKAQKKWFWFLPQTETHRTEGLISWDEGKLRERVGALAGFQEGFAEAPADAYIAAYTPETGFTIVEERQGNELDREKTEAAVRNAVETLEERLDLEAAGCYRVPQVTSEDENLRALLGQLRSYGDLKITYHFGDNTEILDGDVISSWLRVEDGAVSLDESQVEAFVVLLRKRYDTIFRPRTFMTSYGEEIRIEGGDYGWWMNYPQEIRELTEMIQRRESGERTPVYYQTADQYGGSDYGDTYVEINLTAQHLFLYKDGVLLLESDLVSGSLARGDDTPPGVYGITYKQRNAVLTNEDYRTPVSWWMPFNRNIGLHDAGWRRSFGGSIYRTNGSHGCINLPPSAAEEIYQNVEKGTAVICYELPGTEPETEEDGTPFSK